MKLTYLFIGIGFLGLTSFSSHNLEKNYTSKTVKNVAYQKVSEGELLISKMDCIGCHNKDRKILGPSYSEIAKKYPLNDKNIAYLTSKIIKGGSGVWGSIPMAAHANLKKEEAKSIVKYILSLR